MIENPKDLDEKPEFNFAVEITSVKTRKVDFGTKILYDIFITTDDPNALVLGTLRASTLFNLKVTPRNEPKKANQKKDFK